MSIHRYDNGMFYPGDSGSLENVGKGASKGFNLNLPWNIYNKEDYRTVGDGEYRYAFERLVFPVVKEFDPELIFISAGFDSCRGDPLGDCDVTQDTFSYITSRLSELAGGRLIAVLEGGYNFGSISLASESVLRTLIGEEMPTKCSVTGFTMQQYRERYRPTYLQFKELDKVRQRWAEYWPVLDEDEELLKLEMETGLRVEDDRCIVGSGDREAIAKKKGLFVK